MKDLRGIITFKKNEKNLYDYLMSKRGYGNFIKDLLEREMKKEIKEGTYQYEKEVR